MYVFHMKNGDIRAKIMIEPNLKQVVCDFSGLYASVTTQGSAVKMYEVATGRRIYDFDPLVNQVGSTGFSNDCRYMVVADSKSPGIKFYLLDEEFSLKARRIS